MTGIIYTPKSGQRSTKQKNTAIPFECHGCQCNFGLTAILRAFDPMTRSSKGTCLDTVRIAMGSDQGSTRKAWYLKHLTRDLWVLLYPSDPNAKTLPRIYMGNAHRLVSKWVNAMEKHTACLPQNCQLQNSLNNLNRNVTPPICFHYIIFATVKSVVISKWPPEMSKLRRGGPKTKRLLLFRNCNTETVHSGRKRHFEILFAPVAMLI